MPKAIGGVSGQVGGLSGRAILVGLTYANGV